MKYIENAFDSILTFIYANWDKYKPCKFDCLIYASGDKRDIDVVNIRLKDSNSKELGRIRFLYPELKIPSGVVCERLSEEFSIEEPISSSIAEAKFKCDNYAFTKPYMFLGIEEPKTVFCQLEEDIINLKTLKVNDKDDYKTKVLKGFVSSLPGKPGTKLSKRLLAFFIGQEWNYSFNPEKVELKITEDEVYLVTDIIPIRLEPNDITRRYLELIGNRALPIRVTKKDNLTGAKMCLREILPLYEELSDLKVRVLNDG